VSAPAILDGGGGNDLIYGGSAASVLLGGLGNDLLVGGAGRNVLIGGAGGDILLGGGSSDLLIAGTTAYDDNDDALLAILAEWTSSRTYAQRVANLRNAGGPVLGDSGIKLQRGETVFDDTEVDTLLGGADLDWLFFDPTRDRAWDKLGSEAAN
jgi:Ca2+-binding RTX toxin-like protein